MHSEPIHQIPLTRLKGVGPALERKFNQLGIYNCLLYTSDAADE